jgi:hypothetical protein
MDDGARANWLGQAGLQTFTWMLQQASGNLSFSVNQKMFMKSVMYLDVEGNRKQLEEWPCAPDVETVQTARAQASKMFKHYCRRACKLIPSIASSQQEETVNKDNLDEENEGLANGDGEREHIEEPRHMNTNIAYLPFGRDEDVIGSISSDINDKGTLAAF